MSRQKRKYFDYAATTPVRKEVVKAMGDYDAKVFGNSESLHAEGVAAQKALNAARTKVARVLSGHSDEIIFTSSGTEANNLALIGTIYAMAEMHGLKKLHAITTVIEHSSVLECFKELEKRGVDVTYLPVNSEGILEIPVFEKALRPETVLISIALANNEIGAIQPISRLVKIVRNFRSSGNWKLEIGNLKNRFPIFHSDASQAPLYIDIGQDRLGVDLLTIDGHKIYGPKGIGALYVRRGTPIAPIMFGGGQQSGRRPGTEPVGLSVGLATALEIAAREREKESKRLTKIRIYAMAEIEKNFPTAILNGGKDFRLPNNINYSFPGVDVEFLVLQLDAVGIACSAKSACMKDERESYVVKALGGALWRAASSVRFSLGKDTKLSDINKLLIVLKSILKPKVRLSDL